MTQNGREAATSLAPAPIGNRRAAKHLAYATFTPAELAEVRSLEDEIRALCPVESPSIEPAVSVLAGAMWRRAKLYAYIDEAGMTRGRADRATLNPALEALDRIERQIIETMRQLAMLPKQAADLGLKLVRLQQQRGYDWSALTPEEKATVDRLISKAETYEGTFGD
ncbi:MAG: hypothetical protein M3Q31_05540 [Actinomycetota bacterium]|nr:hypothetical protein [Actinomycetota bacterium]